MQVDFGAGPESDHNIHLPPHAHYEHTSHGSPAYTPFRHPQVPGIEGIDQSSGTNRNGHPMSSVHQSAPNHMLQSDNGALNSQHLPHAFYGDMSRASQTPSTPSNASPRFSAISPASQPKQPSHYTPTDRNAPSRDVSDDTLDGAYAAFILYCNPSFATTIDTAELTRLFRTPPKSDGKAFSTWTLFELIRKFDANEIKTWTQLALDLGVERPDTEKGQSTQKVQQYSVRLKVRNTSVLASGSFHFHSFLHLVAQIRVVNRTQQVLSIFVYHQLECTTVTFRTFGNIASSKALEVCFRSLDVSPGTSLRTAELRSPTAQLHTPDIVTGPRHVQHEDAVDLMTLAPSYQSQSFLIRILMLAAMDARNAH
jgi:hypothetical protein